MSSDDQTLPLENTAADADPSPVTTIPPAAAALSGAEPRPRTRWAGIVWGLALAAIAVAGVWLTASAGRVDDMTAWVRDLTAATAIGYGVLSVGALMLVTGLVGLLRRAQRSVAVRRGGPPA